MTRTLTTDFFKKGEDSFTEFKYYSSFDKCDNTKLASSLAAFANTHDGTIYIGVDDNGDVKGVSEPDRWMQRIDNICENNIKPTFNCAQEKILIEGILIIKIKIEKGKQRPYTVDGKIYVRRSASKREATRDEIRNMFLSSGTLFSDECSIQGTSLEDIDWIYFEYFFEKYYNDFYILNKNIFQSQNSKTDFLHASNKENVFKENALRILKNMNILNDNKLTTAGLLFFGKKPQVFAPFYKISAIVFKGTQISDEMIKQDIEGKIENQIIDISTFLQNNISIETKIEGFNKENFGKVPMTVLRECIVNALVHRDYNIASQIRVFIFENRIEIKNPGELLNSLTVESLKLGSHRERNPVISGLMAKLGYMTSIGTGIPRIFRIMVESGFPEPEIISEYGEFQIRLWLKK